EYTGFEEVGEQRSINEEKQNNSENATKAQINTIFSIAKNLNMSNDKLRELIQDKTGKSFSKDLSKSDASKIIRLLKERDAVENQETKLM
ncbi:MAG: hypothetical protein GX301_03770, partial [Gracilibacteraceae bacterium]|nr:hypothetical protein [Gracilibacteraceae bacterium]